jgi:excinuclease ABC A subunit
MVGVAGVSGSGKSSLISDTLVPKLKELLHNRCVYEEEDEEETLVQAGLSGFEGLKKCVVIDQKPIGRTKTSCPATYTGVLDRVRGLFAAADAAVENGYSAGMFSVNSEGGCRVCHGEGSVRYYMGMGNFIDMNCEACGGAGYVPEALEVLLDGKNIRKILDMTVDEARLFFEGKDDTTVNILKVLQRVGMGYITLGQRTPTISGGESQRIKLAKELSKGKNSKDTLYILDEPTTGLSFYDSERLMTLLQELVDRGNSVIITEHDPVVLSNCDYIIELGKGGGLEGGNIIAAGSPVQLKQSQDSIIGRYLK